MNGCIQVSSFKLNINLFLSGERDEVIFGSFIAPLLKGAAKENESKPDSLELHAQTW